MKADSRIRFLAIASAVAAAMSLVSCGSGSSSSTSSNPASGASNTGYLSVALTDAPSDNFQHLWVTITGIALHTDPNNTWSNADATWVTESVPNGAVTIDLASLNNGTLSTLLSNIKLPVGNYRQIRFFLLSNQDPLNASASSTLDHEATPAPLAYNNQVEFLDASNTIQEAPLAIPYPSQGLKLNGTFKVTAGSTLNLAVDIDLDSSVVATSSGFVLRHTMNYYDLSKVGAITGTVNPASLCKTAANGSFTSITNCAFNAVVKAELGDNVRHFTLRQTSVDPVTGKFTLFPVALTDSSGAPLSYDLVVRGRQMNTIIVTGVTPTSSANPTSSATVVPTLTPTINSSEYTAQFTSSLNPLTGGFAVFQETLPALSATPYEIRVASTDPFTGLLPRPERLENGPVQVIAFTSGGLGTVVTQTPTEGTGGYLVGTNTMPAFYNFSAEASNALIAPPAGSGPVLFAPPSPTLASANAAGAVSSGAISVNLALSNISTYDKGYLVLEHEGKIITTVDIASSLGASATGTVPTINLSGIPAGSSTVKQPGATYYGYFVLWNSAHPFKTLKVLHIPQLIDLRSSNSAVVTLGTLDTTATAAGI